MILTLFMNCKCTIYILKVYLLADDARGFLRTKITESPLKNIFEMNRSLLTGLTFFLPFPVLGISVHISLTLEGINIIDVFFISKIQVQKYTSPKPCCNVDQMLLRVPTVSYCYGN